MALRSVILREPRDVTGLLRAWAAGDAHRCSSRIEIRSRARRRLFGFRQCWPPTGPDSACSCRESAIFGFMRPNRCANRSDLVPKLFGSSRASCRCGRRPSPSRSRISSDSKTPSRTGLRRGCQRVRSPRTRRRWRLSRHQACDGSPRPVCRQQASHAVRRLEPIVNQAPRYADAWAWLEKSYAGWRHRPALQVGRWTTPERVRSQPRHEPLTCSPVCTKRRSHSRSPIGRSETLSTGNGRRSARSTSIGGPRRCTHCWELYAIAPGNMRCVRTRDPSLSENNSTGAQRR